MKRTASAMEVRRKFGEILEGVYYKNDEVVIERHGKVMGVLVNPEDYELIEQDRKRVREMFERDLDSDVPIVAAEAMEIALLAQEAVRADAKENADRRSKKSA